MNCFHPLVGLWWKPDLHEDDCNLIKPKILQVYKDGLSFERLFFDSQLPLYLIDKVAPIILPCGKCDGCHMERSLMWTCRNIYESKYHDMSCFLTLTCSDSNIDDVFPNGSLSHYHFQLFLKKLRKKHEVRYFMCGEYGENTQRPHFHVLLYGYDFPDRQFVKFDEHGFPLYRSDELDDFWGKGHSWIGELCEGTIAYVSRYVLKKLPSKLSYNGKSPEYIRMSLKPGIGYQFFDDFGTSVYSHGDDLIFPQNYVFCGDLKIKPPRYFDKLYERLHNADYVSLKNYRRSLAESLNSVRESDLRAAEAYLKSVTKGRIKKGVTNV